MMLALLLAQAAAALPAPRSDVVVVAPRDCATQRCTPEEEAAAALAAANAHYLAGDYRAAHRTIRAALDRLRGAARAHPEAVADLLTGAGRIDAHLGDFDAYTTDSRRALLIARDAYGPSDPRTIERRLTAGAAWLDAGKRESGLAELAGAVEDADRGTDMEMRARARLKLANAIVLVSDRGGERERVAALLAPVLATPGPAFEGYRYAARIAIAKLAARRGDPAPLAALAATLPVATPAPLLVAAEQARMPAYQFPEETCEPNRAGATGTNAPGEASGTMTLLGCDNAIQQRTSQQFEKQWLDVAFTVGADGRPNDVAVARQSGQIEGAWVEEVLRAVRARRYALRADRAGTQRRERFTLTARYRIPTGSRIPVREARPVIEMVDISGDRAAYIGRAR